MPQIPLGGDIFMKEKINQPANQPTNKCLSWEHFLLFVVAAVVVSSYLHQQKLADIHNTKHFFPTI